MSANTDSHVIIAKPIIVNSNGIGFQTSYNGKISFSTYSKGTVINKATYGLYSASMGEIYLFDANTVTFGSNVTTKYSTIGGGRIFTGTQGWQPIGSVTGNHEMAVDTNLYTEFLVVQNYNNTKHRYLISANEISGDPFSCRDGSYMHSTAYTGASITVYPYAKIIKNGISYVNGTDVLANTTMTIYGRRA